MSDVSHNSWLAWLLWSAIAISVASIVGSASFLVGLKLSMMYFVSKYPHDGQDILGCLFIGFVAGATMWICTVVVVIQWRLVLQRRRKDNEKMQPPTRYSITGRPL